MNVSIIRKKLEKYLTKCETTGEVIVKERYKRTTPVRIGSRVKTIMAWVYISHYQCVPEGRVRTISDNPKSVDPEFLICSADLEGEIVFEKGGNRWASA